MQARYLCQAPPTTCHYPSFCLTPPAIDLRPIAQICDLFPCPPPTQGRESGLFPAPQDIPPCNISCDPLWPQHHDISKKPKGMSGCVTPSLPGVGSRLCSHSPKKPAPSSPPGHFPGPGLFLLPSWTPAELPNPALVTTYSCLLGPEAACAQGLSTPFLSITFMSWPHTLSKKAHS